MRWVDQRRESVMAMRVGCVGGDAGAVRAGVGEGPSEESGCWRGAFSVGEFGCVVLSWRGWLLASRGLYRKKLRRGWSSVS